MGLTNCCCAEERWYKLVLKKHAQPLPHIVYTLEVLAVSCWFSTLDLASGYWQVEVDHKDR